MLDIIHIHHYHFALTLRSFYRTLWEWQSCSQRDGLKMGIV